METFVELKNDGKLRHCLNLNPYPHSNPNQSVSQSNLYLSTVASSGLQKIVISTLPFAAQIYFWKNAVFPISGKENNLCLRHLSQIHQIVYQIEA